MRFKEKLKGIVLLFIAANIFLIILGLVTLDDKTLMKVIPIFFAVNMLTIIITFLIDVKKIAKLFSKISKRTWIFLLLILVIAFSLRAFVAPDTHRLYFDEDIYLGIAQNIVNDGRAILCNRGTPDNCIEGVLNKQPQGLPFFLSLFFLVTGPDERVASIVMILVSTASVALLFFLSYMIFRKEELALYAALFFALIPIHIIWAPAISSETLLVFFTVLAMLGFFLYFNNHSFPTLLFAVASLAFAAQLRPEAPLLLGLAAFLFIREKLDSKVVLACIVLLVLISPYMLQFKNVRSDTWGSSGGEKLSLKYLPGNAAVNSKFFIENTRFPLGFTIFSLCGLVFLLLQRKAMLTSMLLIWFFIFFSMYAVFYAGSFNYGADVRFSANLYPPMVIAAGFGAYTIKEKITSIIKKKAIGSGIVIAGICILFIPFIPFIHAIGEEAWDARIVHDFAIKEASKLDKNCYIFTHVPTMFLVNGNNALQTWFGSNKVIADEIFSKTDCVLFYEGYWCVNVERYKNTVCKYMHDSYNLEVHAQVTERDKTFTIYKVYRK